MLGCQLAAHAPASGSRIHEHDTTLPHYRVPWPQNEFFIPQENSTRQ